MARSGLAAPGQREQITRDERTNPLKIMWQVLWFAIAAVLGFGIVRTYIYFWEWIGRHKLHSTLGPIAGILFLACAIAVIALFIEVFDPNWPNPRDATPSTRPLFPWHRERMQPKVSNRIKVRDLLDALDLEMEDDDEPE